jgi:transcriptional regulator with XRE-family HTH domain
MHPYFKRLGDRIRAARKAKGWTQQELAEKTGMTAAFLSYLENGSRRAGFESLLKLAEALSVEPEFLLGGKLGQEKPETPYISVSLEGLTAGEGNMVRKMAQTLRRKKR